MRVVVKEQYREAEKEYYTLSKDKRGNMLMITAVDFRDEEMLK